MAKYVGTPASGGLTMAKIKIVNRRIAGFKRVVLTPHRERALYNAALILAKDELADIVQHTSNEHKDILNFQILMLDDAGLNQMILEQIEQQQGMFR